MLILLTIFLLLLAPLIMLVLHLVRPKFRFQGFIGVLATLAGWILVLLSRGQEPLLINLPRWEPDLFFPTSPVLLIDDSSRNFALALVSLSLALIITSIAQLGQSLKLSRIQVTQHNAVPIPQVSNEKAQSDGGPTNNGSSSIASNWQSWAGMLLLTSIGLVAVTAGNLLTLLLAWAALDVLELLILLGQVLESRSRERIILAFTARIAGIGTVLLAAIIPWYHGSSLSYDAITQSTSIYLLIAAGLRLGVLPLHLPYSQVLPLSRGLGTILRLVSAASSFILLVRVSSVGINGPAAPYLVVLTLLAGLFAAFNWMNARDEINGRPYWLLATGSLVVVSAILNRPVACLTWCIASLLSGGMVFSMALRHKNLAPLAVMGLFNLSALPFSPTWMGASLYDYSSVYTNWIPQWLYYSFFIAIVFTHSLLLTGFARHALRGMLLPEDQKEVHIERWVWLLYPLGLAVILVAHFLIGWFLYPDFHVVPLLGWLAGMITVVISGLLWLESIRHPRILSYRLLSVKGSPLNRFVSMEWIYPLFWRLFRLLTRLSTLFSTILEGDGGILWAMVLFALIFVFLQR